MQDKILKCEVVEMSVENSDGCFLPNFSYSGNDEEYYYDFKLLKTAEEVYQEWLKNKDEQIDNSSKEIKTNEQLANELLESQKVLLSLQEQVIDILINQT